ncbi:MAG: hypothetical protein E7591_05840 [Ruminococcaceae bacterium]|nr:hypothetical protein [Oscillospiraceae bacterium]
MNKDTKKLQDMLDCCGDVYVHDGLYIIDEPLRIHDNTHLRCAKNAVIRLADGANCEILINDKCAVDYNENITVEGGIWDGNNLNQQRYEQPRDEWPDRFYRERYFGVFMRFIGVRNLRVCNLTIKDPNAYCMQLAMVHHFTVENIYFDENMAFGWTDGVHVNGPAKDGLIRNIRGATNDDMIALNCDDCYETEISSGNIEDVCIDGVYAENGYTGVRLLSCGHTLHNVQIRNVFGDFRYYGIAFTHHNVHPGAKNLIDNITIDGVFIKKTNPRDTYPIIYFAKGTHTTRATLRNIHRVEDHSTEASNVKIEAGAVIDRLVIDDMTLRYNEGSGPDMIVNEGEVKEFKMR